MDVLRGRGTLFHGEGHGSSVRVTLPDLVLRASSFVWSWFESFIIKLYNIIFSWVLWGIVVNYWIQEGSRGPPGPVAIWWEVQVSWRSPNLWLSPQMGKVLLGTVHFNLWSLMLTLGAPIRIELCCHIQRLYWWPWRRWACPAPVSQDFRRVTAPRWDFFPLTSHHPMYFVFSGTCVLGKTHKWISF